MELQEGLRRSILRKSVSLSYFNLPATPFSGTLGTSRCKIPQTAKENILNAAIRYFDPKNSRNLQTYDRDTFSTYSEYSKYSKYSRCSSRFYGNLASEWLPKRYQYTKYRISKPWTSDSTYDDIFLSEPSKEDFYPFSKEMPVFLKFLKLLTAAQNRKEAFVEFARRCETGLVVEKDVYVTKDELLECMWSNGYVQGEIDAIRLGFPDDYRFHYPELAVLFELEEEDCYRYCLRQRASNPEELVELKYKKPDNLISSYGLIFLGLWFGLSNAVLGNAWFFAKTLPFGAVFYMLAAYFQKSVKEYLWKEELALIDKAKAEKDYCEDALYNQLKKYIDDSKCSEYMESFKDQVSGRMREYRAALLQRLKSDATKKMNEKLRAMLSQEECIASSLKTLMVKELVDEFLEKFPLDDQMRQNAITAAIADIRGDSSKERDPVYLFFQTQLSSFQTGQGKLVERFGEIFERMESEFLNSFSVSESESKQVADLAKKCKDGEKLNLSKLSEEQLEHLQTLFDSFNERLGYYVPSIAKAKLQSHDNQKYIDTVNRQVSKQLEEIRKKRLGTFLQTFC